MPNTTSQPGSGAEAVSTVDVSNISAATNSVRELEGGIESAKRGSLKLGSTLVTALDGVITKGKSASSVVDALALSLSKAALNAALKPLDQFFSSAAGNLFSGSLFDNATPFAAGGVFSAGLPVPFASGGVIASPVSFPLGSGQTGIAGERGAEAIMPLTRGSDGKLGVATSGSGAPVNVTFHVTSPDAESFTRSETQLAAMLARAVSQGQRNL